jgi:hypothetical protein
MRWTGYVACMGKMRNAYEDLVGIPEAKGLLGRQRHTRENNIEMDSGEIDRMVWTGFIWLKIVTNGRLLQSLRQTA